MLIVSLFFFKTDSSSHAKKLQSSCSICENVLLQYRLTAQLKPIFIYYNDPMISWNCTKNYYIMPTKLIISFLPDTLTLF